MVVLNVGSGKPQSTITAVQSGEMNEGQAGTYINDHGPLSKTIILQGIARSSSFAAAMFLVASTAQPAVALVIHPVYDSSITSLANASTIEAAFNTVAHDYASQFTNSAQINVRVSWGSVGGQALPSGAVGASTSSLWGYFTYNQVKSYLTSAALSNPLNTALATAVAHLPLTAPAGVSQYVIPSSELKVLGVISPTQAGIDGSIGFAGSTSGYSFNPASGVAAGTYDFQAVAAHELDEVLGRVSGLSSTTPSYRTVFDLFRYKSPGVLSFSYSEAAYFSIDGGITNLGNFNNTGSGDRSDWLTLAGSKDIQDAFISTGQRKNLTAVDLTGLDVLGYGGLNLGNTAWATPQAIAFHLVEPMPDIEPVPEPGSLTLLASMLGLLGAAGLRWQLSR